MAYSKNSIHNTPPRVFHFVQGDASKGLALRATDITNPPKQLRCVLYPEWRVWLPLELLEIHLSRYNLHTTNSPISNVHFMSFSTFTKLCKFSPPLPGNHSSIFCPYRFAFSRHFLQREPYSIWPHVWLRLCRMFLRFFRVVACIRTLLPFLVEENSIVGLDRLLGLRSSVDGCLGCFRFLAFTDNVATIIGVQVFG